MIVIPNTDEDLDQNFWFRTFNRGDDPVTKQPKEDTDQVADVQYQKDNFVDHFGKLLTDPENQSFRKLNTYHELGSHFWDDENTIVQTYCVADGQTIPEAEQKEWFRSELRFLSLILPTDKDHPKKSVAPVSSVSWAPWFLLIAASSAIDSDQDILHIMSWSQADGQFRYYARDVIMNDQKEEMRGWVYLCSSEDAFDEQGKAYMGPLNGHVNGGLVMKEIHKPWLHWLVGGRGVFELINKNTELKTSLGAARWLTAEGYPPLYGASVQSAENLERVVLDALRMWFDSRRKKDFLNVDKTTRESPLHIQRWAAHFLLTTNLNIIAVPTSDYVIPSDFFFQYETLRGYGDLLPNSVQTTTHWQETHKYWGDSLKVFNDTNPFGQNFPEAKDWYDNYTIPSFKYDNGTYLSAARQLKLCTLQEVPVETPGAVIFHRDTMSGGVFMGTLNDGKERIEGRTQIAFAVTRWGEGDNPWVILQSSVEDAMGVWMAQKMFLGTDRAKSRCRLFSDRVFNALMMVDFWNPIFSWRRLRLMQYIPVDTTLVDPVEDPFIGEDVYTYELEQRFINNITDAMRHWEGEKASPEREFINNLKMPVLAHQIRVYNYTMAVSNNLGSHEFVLKYMRLAESRRRMFRPLPMNFFGSNLPYCLGIDPTAPLLEMTETGDVADIPANGVRYLHDWLGSLAGSNPTIIPEPTERRDRIDSGKPPVPRTALPRPATMRMQCQASIVTTNPPRSAGGCPYMAKAYRQRLTNQLGLAGEH